MPSGGVKKRERSSARRYADVIAAVDSIIALGIDIEHIEFQERLHTALSMDEQYQIKPGERRLRVMKAIREALR